jgi:hypothetical protein
VDGFESPSSVYGVDTFIFVSNVGKALQPLSKDGDGFVAKLGKSGVLLNRFFIAGLDAPRGMACWDSVLYIADLGKIKAFNWKTGDSLDVFDLGDFQVHFLKDLCKGDSGFIYASETLQNKLYRIDVKRRGAGPYVAVQSVPQSAAVKGISALWYDAPSRDLYIAGFGESDSANGAIGVIPYGPRAIPPRRWESHQGKIAGLCMVEGVVFFTDWNGFEQGQALYMLNLGTSEVTALPLGRIGGPSDFWYDQQQNACWIPSMTEGKVYVIKNEGIKN